MANHTKYDSVLEFYLKEIMPTLDKTDGYLVMDLNNNLFWCNELPTFNLSTLAHNVENTDFLGNYAGVVSVNQIWHSLYAVNFFTSLKRY